MKRTLLTLLIVLFSLIQICYSQDNVRRCKQDKSSMLAYWAGETEPKSWNTKDNYYDSDNNLAMVIVSNTENDVTTLSSREENFYDEENLLTNNIVYHWRSDLKMWLKTSESKYMYSDGKLTKIEIWNYFNVEPKMESYKEYTYDAEGQLIKESHMEQDYSTGGFVTSKQTSYQDFIAFNKPQKGIIEQFDYSAMSLYVYAKFDISYDEDFNPILKVFKSKNHDVEGDFIEEEKEEWIYVDGKNTEYIKYIMDYEKMEFTPNQKEVYDYDEIIDDLIRTDTYIYDLEVSETGWNWSGFNERFYSNIYNTNKAAHNLGVTVLENAVNTVKISWTAPDNVEGLSGYRIIKDGYSMPEIVEGTEYVDSKLLNGTHTYIVQSVYGDEGANISSSTTVSVFDPACVPPTDLELVSTEYDEVMSEFTVNIEWKAPETDKTILGYNIYRNNSQVSYGIVKKTTFKDQVYEIGTFTYQVVAIYDTGNSNFSEPLEVTLKPSSVTRLNNSNVKVFPNPAIDKLYFTEEVSQVIIYDLSGRIVKRVEGSGVSSINLDGIKHGVYTIITIDDRNSISTNKIVIK